MTFSIQNPDNPNTDYLLETLLEACSSADAGGGAFAFVSPAGVKLLLGDSAFDRFKSKTFSLVIGTDAVTTPKSLAAIAKVGARLKGLKVQAFVNSKLNSAFHPKFCWFRDATGGKIITGSGNLTKGGLVSNWEAYSVEELSVSGVDAVEKYWNEWLAASSAYLRQLSDKEVLARVEENALHPGKRVVKVESPEGEEKGASAEKANPTSEVLIAEIPRGSTRWNQANFDLETFETYFGGKPGSHRRILLYHSAPDGTLPEIPESRQCFSVKSHNFRFELGAASGLAYPRSGRPIVVFVRVATRIFRYMLLMPGSQTYQIVEKYLVANTTAQPPRMRRLRTTAENLLAAWPKSPLLAL